jgi:hypothetical protein
MRSLLALELRRHSSEANIEHCACWDSWWDLEQIFSSTAREFNEDITTLLSDRCLARNVEFDSKRASIQSQSSVT